MKVTFLISLMMVLGALFRPPVYAAPNLPQAQGTSEGASKPASNPSDAGKNVLAGDVHPNGATAQRGARGRGLPGNNLPRGRAAVTKQIHQQAVGNSQAGLPLAQNAGSIRPQGSPQPAAAVNRNAVPNESIYRALPVRSGSSVHPGEPSAVRHRDPNAAVIGGAASPNGRRTASLDGAHMNLKASRN